MAVRILFVGGTNEIIAIGEEEVSYSVTSAIFAKKAKTFSHGNGTATEKTFHFRGSSASVGDKFFLVPARPGYG
jgi:hypothetical protein